jgi:hypothetical protein
MSCKGGGGRRDRWALNIAGGNGNTTNTSGVCGKKAGFIE